MGNIGLLLFHAFIALFAFFVVAPYILNTISLFGVQKRFAQTMIDEGIISAEDVKRLQIPKQIASTIISAALLAALLLFCSSLQMAGLIVATIPLMLGLFKYRKIAKHPTLAARRFQSTYQGRFDIKKYNKYVDKHF